MISAASTFDSYVLPTGEVLIVHDDGSGIIWKSRAVVENIISTTPTDPTHILANMMPIGQGFVEAVPALIKSLATRLGIDSAVLDGSVESLKVIDKYVFDRIGAAACLADAGLFQELVAYFGEVIRIKRGGVWELRRVEPAIWEPWIVDGEGKRTAPFIILFEELHEPRAAHSLYYLVC
jgi:hypothetical protein